MKPTICLSMIVKNEAHCISKCLESVKPFINYWIICDTGSSDNTEEIVTNIMKDIPGEFHHHEWKDFSHNRNLSLQLSKNKSDYTLIIDADDYLQFNNLNIFDNLNQPLYNINIKHDSIIYPRPQLIRNNIDYKYVGVLHEYLEGPPNTPHNFLNNCFIIFGANGARWKDPNKYAKDAEVFRKELLKDPNNSRNLFYCAQSYRDCNQLENALTYYTKRVAVGGWAEETYCSLLEIAKITEKLRSFDSVTVEAAYLKSFNFLPTRAESLMYLAAYCRKQKQYDKAYFYASMGVNISMPSNGLFVDYGAYDWKLKDELAIAAFYIGKKNQSAQLNKTLLSSGLVPENNIDRIKKNLSFCLK